MKQPYSQRGFSLVELIMVISIISLVTVIALPKVGLVIDDVSEKAVSDRLIEDMNLLRGMAMSQHDTTWLVVDQAQNQYSLWVGPYASRVLIPDPDTGDSQVLDLDSAYAGVTISSVNFGGSSEVSFNWWGTPSSAGTIVINGTRTITLVAETGMVYE